MPHFVRNLVESFPFLDVDENFMNELRLSLPYGRRTKRTKIKGDRTHR